MPSPKSKPGFPKRGRVLQRERRPDGAYLKTRIGCLAMTLASESGSAATHVAKKMGDKVYTPRWVARDMVAYFQPTGRVLDPCRGDGAFTDALPSAEWCEIDDGRDFFAWREPVDWVVGNPPYSMTRQWFRHSYLIARHLLYLVPLRNVFSGYGFVKEIHDFGGIRAIRTYGTGNRLGFPMGNAIGAFHIERGYSGPTRLSLFDDTAQEVLGLSA